MSTVPDFISVPPRTAFFFFYDATSKATSSSMGIPSGRLATPMTSRTAILSLPKMSRNRSDAPSATFG